MKIINPKDYCPYYTNNTFLKAPDKIYERNFTSEQLHTAIAKAEGVNEKSIRISIKRGLHRIKNFLKLIDDNPISDYNIIVLNRIIPR
ncbi:hypothetical protein [Anaerovorax odorimutans]|uniref:hypothetical protein n=1 Tax=Anaerovorax odorimutans TaxID=109327 RepID=UPI001FE055EE|nr:hypothetical protein [Anaerovorax odorimutans]